MPQPKPLSSYSLKSLFTSSRKDMSHHLGQYLMLSVGAMLLAFSYAAFLYPASIAPGGVGGITLILVKFMPFSPGQILFMLNIPMLILGFYNLGRFKFLLRTAYVVLINNTLTDVFLYLIKEPIVPDDLFLASLYGGAIGGIGFGIILRAQGNSGGTGILSRVIQLRTSLPISQIYLMVDGFIILALGIVFGWESSLYSLTALFISGLATDYAYEGPSVVRTMFIITHKPDAVSKAIRENFYIGVTQWEGKGTYTSKERSILFCTAMRADAYRIREVAYIHDPKAFIVIAQGHTSQGGIVGKSKLEKGRLKSVEEALEEGLEEGLLEQSPLPKP